MAASSNANSRRETRMTRALVGIGALCLALGLGAGPLLAQTPMTPEMKERLKKADKNGDGKIDRAEFQELVIEGFFFMDSQRRGYLVITEIRGMSPEAFRAADKNGDGRLSLEEYLNAMFKDFDAADRDHDGSVTVDELDIYTRG